MIVGFAAIVAGILVLGGDIMNFLNLPSVILVIVPTFSSIISAVPLSTVKKMGAHIKAVMRPEPNPWDYVQQIVDLAQTARKEGLLAFEKVQVDDKLMMYALRMMVDGLDKFDVKFALEDSLNGMKERHAESLSIYDKGASYAPAFGMCATVVSLVNMLMGLDFSDPNAINNLGGNMAAALITTLYGSMFANIIFLPISSRLKALHKKELFCKTMICNGLLAILNGDNPRVINDYLVEQLSKADAKGQAAAAGGGAKPAGGEA
jgi:chemotaxis protein MotA